MNTQPASKPAPAATPARTETVRLLTRIISRIDQLLSRQVNAILHHPDFQRLEASWRGLQYLVGQVPEGAPVKVRVLHVAWKELCRDLERAMEFDQSQFFQKVYSEEFGTPGGQPFGVLLGDYAVRHRMNARSPTDDVRALTHISSAAAAAFAPFVAGAHPSLLDMDDFAGLERPLDLPRTFQQIEYMKWRAFRQTEDSRFVGLTLPRVLMRPPHGGPGGRADGFSFREEAGGPGRERCLWGNAVYAFGAVLVRAFAEHGWLAEIRGIPAGGRGGGLAPDLPAYPFRTDKPGVAPRPSTDAAIVDPLEKELGELGFLSLCHCPDTDRAAFYGGRSVQQVRTYDEPAANANARLSAMLPHILCVSRFAHYLKVIARDKVGALGTPQACEEYLQRWLAGYVVSNDVVSEEVRAKCPLREARVEVREHPGKPGSYLCVAHLLPHSRLEHVAASIRLTTVLARERSP